MIRFLIDTNIISYLMKKKHPFHKSVMNTLLNQEEGSVAISVISSCEIARGIEAVVEPLKKETLLKAVQLIFSSIAVLEFNDDAAWEYGKVRTALINSGQDIGIMDSLIAAHAISQNLMLVTHNLQHFQRIPHLKVTSWVENL